MRIEKNKIYSTKELARLILEEKPNRKTSSIYSKINELVLNGVITRIGKSKYVCKTLNVFSYELESATAKKIFGFINQQYPSDFEFVIYETKTVLNQFLNHLLVQNNIVLEVPKFFMNQVFYSLKENGFKKVLLNPSKNELFKYNEDNAIIILPLISKSPINKKEKKTTIEKLTIDIIASDILHCFFEGAEIPNMVEDILLHHQVKYDTLSNYAKRRHAYKELVGYVPLGIKEHFFND